MTIARIVSVALLVTACSGSAPTPPPPGPAPVPVTPPAAPATPCATDADCRLEDASGCRCIGANVADPVGPGCPHPCFAPPCMNQVAACDPSSHLCVARPASAPPPPPEVAPPS